MITIGIIKKNKERLQERARNRYYEEGGKGKKKNIMKITKKSCKNNPEINTENYPTKKRIYKESMEEIDKEKCQKKIKNN